MSVLFVFIMGIIALRVLFSLLPLSHEFLVKYLNDKLNTTLVIEEVSLDWHPGHPSLHVEGLSLRGNTAHKDALHIHRLDFEIDVFKSLYHFSPIFSKLKANGIQLNVESDRDGVWSLHGIYHIRKKPDDSGVKLQPLLAHLQWQNQINLNDVAVNVVAYGQLDTNLTVETFSFYDDSGRKKISGHLSLGEGKVSLQAHGSSLYRLNREWSGQVTADNLNPVDWCVFSQLCTSVPISALVHLDSQWQYHNGFWQLQGTLNLNDVTPANGRHGSPFNIKTDLSAVGNSVNKTWRAQASSFTIVSEDQPPLQLDLRIIGNGKKNTYELSLPTIDLNHLKAVLTPSALLTRELSAVLRDLNPTGHLNDLTVKYHPSKPQRDALSIIADLRNISVEAWKYAPSVTNVNGRLDMGLRHGHLDLASNQINVRFPEMDNSIMPLHDVTGRLSWDLPEQKKTVLIDSDNLEIHDPEGDVNGVLALDIPLNGSPGWMKLDISVTDGDITHAKKYIPEQLNGQLATWLREGLKAGRVTRADFHYDGLFGGEKEWGVSVDFEEAHAGYSTEWPDVYDATGHVDIGSGTVTVDVTSARALDTALNNISAVVDYADSAVLNLTGLFHSNGSDLKKLLTETPIKQYMEPSADQWRIAGQLDGDLSLQMLFGDDIDTSVVVNSAIEEGAFGAFSVVQLDHIEGNATFSTKEGLSAQRLTANLLGNHITASISPKKIRGDDTTIFQWHGNLSSEAIEQLLPADARGFLKGKTAYQGQFIMGHNNQFGNLSLSTDMNGMAVELPPPFQLAADHTRQVQIELNLAKEELHELFIRLENIGMGHISLTRELDVSAANLRFGSTPKDHIPLTPSRIVVAGDIPELDIAPWKHQFFNQSITQQQTALLEKMEVNNLYIGRLAYEQNALEDLRLTVHSPSEKDGSVAVLINSPDIDGQLVIPGQAETPYQLNMKRLHLPASENSASSKTDEHPKDLLAQVAPTSLPDIDVLIASLKLGTRDFGSVAFNLRPTPHGKHIQSFKGSMNAVNITGDTQWIQPDNGLHVTTHSGTLSGKGIDDFQKVMGLSPFASAKSSEIQSHLHWNGTPVGINLSSLEGTVNLKLKNGKLRRIEGGTDVVKLLGLFNLEALKRRLSLDFSDLFRKGISFDRLDGTLHFQQGIVTFDEPLVVTGPSVDFMVDGIIDTRNDKLDLGLIITLPVSSNLPILSLLFGTAPQVAGVIYLADLLVGKQVDKLASIRYEIKGSTNDPKVSLNRLFSSPVKKTKKKNIKKRVKEK